MKRLYIYITILVSLSILTSCLDDLTQDFDFEFEEQVFISGLLTNETDFVSVQIQKTVPVTDTTFSTVNDVQIFLYSRDASNTVLLVTDSFTTDNGDYMSSEMITPITGNTYWIEAVLQDQTVLTSEEEILKPSIPIISMVKTGDIVRVTVTDQIEDENFYLVQFEVLKDGILIDEFLGVFNDSFVTDNLEEFIEIDGIREGDTVRASIYNINFNTFQFYANLLNNLDDDLVLSSLFTPTNIVGNITNTTINEQALGNFGIAGFSSMTKDF
ncbi:hypothetical protein GCM10022393_33720 [Aquimarina addita]|uniref:DUF4249 family protein n=1 Tax=Aquimarina addita TaxID=870485 RepID=A0ABP6UTG5_9FLAO